MTESTHDTADDGFHEIQLSGKQLVFLFIFTTLVSVAIFLCGVLVGRGARTASGDAPVSLAVETSPAPPAAAQPSRPAVEPPPPAEVPDELSYHKRLQADAPATETLKKPGTTAVPVEPPAQKAPAASTPPPPVPTATTGGDVPVAGKPGTWGIQVQALTDRAVAAALVKRLTSQGYPAFLVSPTPGAAPQFYKVQVGRYAQRREAEDVKRRLEKEEQFTPWIFR